MRTIASTSLLLVAGLLSASAHADDWTSPKDVAKAAREFATATEKLRKAIKDVDADSPLVAEAASLSKSSTQLHDSVDKGAAYEGAKKDFRKVEGDYAHFEAGLKKAHDVHHEKTVAEAAKRAKATFDGLQAHMAGRRPSDKTDPISPPRPSREDDR